MSYKMRKMKNKLLAATLIAVISTTVTTACAKQLSGQAKVQVETSNSSNTSDDKTSEISVSYDSEDKDTGKNSSAVTNITLSSNKIAVDGTGAAVKGSKVTISSAGTYSINGKLTNGQIIVDTEDKETVKLILNGAEITFSNSAPIYVKNAKKTVLTLKAGTKNTLTDGTNYIFENKDSEEPNAALFAKSDLTINGNGSLIVNANYNDGIASKDELKIVSGNITVNAAGDGIRGRDYVAVKDGAITINAKKDGIKSNNDEDTAKGFVVIDGGKLNITASEDGIQAETNILINAGDINISSGGGSKNGTKKAEVQPGMRPEGVQPMGDFQAMTEIKPAEETQKTKESSQTSKSSETSEDSETSDSKKGIKAVNAVRIDGGTLQIDAADDAIHSDNRLVINGGTLDVLAGDDALHSEKTLDVNGGTIDIKKSYEGIESEAITINNGTIHLVSSDDAINASGSSVESATAEKTVNAANTETGKNGFNYPAGNGTLTINGGYVVLDALGDGLDANGSIKMTAGKVIVNGPTNSGNGALDYDGSFVMTGGELIAAGSSGMAQSPNSSSSQNSVMINFDTVQKAGTIVHIETEKGDEVLTFAPAKDYQSIVVCSPKLKKGSNYKIYYGGSAAGTNKDGLYSGGSYTGGTNFKSFTVSEVITKVGTFSARGMGGGKLGRGPRQMQ